MKILQNSDKQLVVAMKDSITILSDDKTLVSVDKEIVCAAANTLGILDDLKEQIRYVNDLCEERERIINECNQKIIDYEAIIKDLKKANEYYIRKENCATPVKECDDYDSSYPPTKVK